MHSQAQLTNSVWPERILTISSISFLELGSSLVRKAARGPALDRLVPPFMLLDNGGGRNGSGLPLLLCGLGWSRRCLRRGGRNVEGSISLWRVAAAAIIGSSNALPHLPQVLPVCLSLCSAAAPHPQRGHRLDCMYYAAALPCVVHL